MSHHPISISQKDQTSSCWQKDRGENWPFFWPLKASLRLGLTKVEGTKLSGAEHRRKVGKKVLLLVSEDEAICKLLQLDEDEAVSEVQKRR